MSAPGKDGRTPDRALLRDVVFGTPAGFMAFGFGAGLSPWAPGTMGTLVAVPIVIVLRYLDPLWYWFVLLLLFGLGVSLCERTSKRLGVHDHGGIVWDEIVGYALAAALVPVTWQWLLAAFVLFRLFDILKPWPIRQLDRKAGGGLGVMIDDVAAGLYTLILLAGFAALLGG